MFHRHPSWLLLALALGGINICAPLLAGEHAATEGAASPQAIVSSPVTLPGAEQFDLTASSGLVYRIFVAAPSSQAPDSGWPVIYLSDGNTNFPVLLTAAQRQSRGGLQAVIVGIGYPEEDMSAHRRRRALDLTPETPAEWLNANSQRFSPTDTGGHDRFLEFIERDLKPVIEQRHAIDRTRQTLFGHSFGGLFALHVLYSRPECFQTYLVTSPSLWWNDGSALVEEQGFLAKYAAGEVRARVFISAGELEQRPASIEPGKQSDVLAQRRMVTRASDLADRLNTAGIRGLTAEFCEFAEEGHGSVVLPAASRGVRFALETAE